MFKKYENQLEEDLKNTLFFADNSKKNIDEYVKQMMFCLQPAIRSNITVFNLNSDSSLSETIFRSICQCKLNNFQQKKRFPIAYN